MILNILWIPNWWFFSHLHYYQSCNHLAIIFVNWAPIYGPFCWFNCWFLTSQALKLSFQLSLLQDTIRSSFFLNLRSSYTSSLKTKKERKKNTESRFHFALCQLCIYLFKIKIRGKTQFVSQKFIISRPNWSKNESPYFFSIALSTTSSTYICQSSFYYS